MPPDLADEKQQQPCPSLASQTIASTTTTTTPVQLTQQSINGGLSDCATLMQTAQPSQQLRGNTSINVTVEGRQYLQPQSSLGRVRPSSGVAGVFDGGSRSQVPPNSKKFYLSPVLRETFSAVGATNKVYLFKEVLNLLKTYLYSKRHLFDPKDILYVNCEGDPLGEALQVSRFHFTDVKVLLAHHVVPAPDEIVSNGSHHQEIPVGSQSANYSGRGTPTQMTSKTDNLTSRAKDENIVNTCSNINLINDKTEQNVSAQIQSSSTSVEGVLHGNDDHSKSSLVVAEDGHANLALPGSSQATSGDVDKVRKQFSFTKEASYEFNITPIPDSDSDLESVHSYQGYETVLCHNTEYEESDDDSVDIIEYELASDEDIHQEYAKDDDHHVQGVEVRVLTLDALHQDDSEKEFWADDSDTIDDSSEEDPELEGECWNCLTCGIKNKPFVRYCGKCWKIRKDWLPDQSKKRKKRKPRPKTTNKKKRRLGPANPEEFCTQDRADSVDLTGSLSSTTNYSVNSLNEPSTSKVSFMPPLSKDLSSASSLARYSSIDSGIFLSQENLSLAHGGESLGNSLDDSSVNSTPQIIDKQIHYKDQKKSDETINGESEKSNSLSSQCTAKIRNCTSTSEPDEVKENTSNKNILNKVDVKAKDFYDFLKSSCGKEWLSSTDGKQFLARKFTKRNMVEALLSKEGNTSTLEAVPKEERVKLLNLCSICKQSKKNASIIHGRLSHQSTCYECAQKLYERRQRCPVCKRKIHMVCKHITA